MKANAPDKLYLSKNIYSTYLYQVPDPDDETNVEYTRTDVCVDKLWNWLGDNLYKYVKLTDDRNDATYDVQIWEDLRQYIDNEM